MVLFRDKGIVFHWLMSYNSTKCSNLKGGVYGKGYDRWESNEDDTEFYDSSFYRKCISAIV